MKMEKNSSVIITRQDHGISRKREKEGKKRDASHFSEALTKKPVTGR